MVKKWFFAALFLVLFGLPALGQALADRVPADALVYIGWSGSDALAADYDKSNLKKFADQTNLEKNLSGLLPGIIKAVARQNPAFTSIGTTLDELLPVFWRRPMAVYFGGASIAQGNFSIKFAIVCDAGANPAGLLKTVKDAAAKTGVPILTELHAGRYIAIGLANSVPESLDQLLDGKAGDSLANAATFKSALTKTSANSALTLYLDAEKMLKMTDDLMSAAAPAQTRDNWRKIRETLALEGIKRVVATWGFNGPQWASRVYIEAPAPRRGIAKILDSKPLSPELFKQIPADSIYAAGFQADLGQMIKTIVSMAGQTDPSIQKSFDNAMNEVQRQLGFHIQNDLLDSLGGEWAAYLSPAVNGTSMTGIVAVNRLGNSAKFTDSMTKLEKFANATITAAMARTPMTLSIKTMVIGKQEIHYLAIPFLAPAYSVRDGVLYLGLYPQSVASAMDYAQAGGKGFSENPAFAALTQRMGGKNPTSFSYSDLPAMAPGYYNIALFVDRLIAGYLDLFGVSMTEPNIPSLPQLMKILAPAGAMSWQDDSGFYMRSVTPFPMANLFGSSAVGNISVAEGALGVSILLPALNAAKERANRVKCASNLRSIGQACMLYNADQKKLPPNLGALVTDTDLNPEAFICPVTGKSVPPGLTPQQQAKWVDDNSDYVYQGAALNMNMPADVVLAYEKPDNHDNQGLNVLFMDGHVEWCTIPMFQQVMARDLQLRGK